MDPYLALITLVPLPFIGWMIHFVRYRLRTGFEKIDRVWGEVTNVLADTIPGIRVVKAFAQEQREAKRFREANRHNLLVNDRINKIWSLFSPSVSLLTEMGCWWCGALASGRCPRAKSRWACCWRPLPTSAVFTAGWIP
jgi:ATP-binding cassette subfamily B protein